MRKNKQRPTSLLLKTLNFTNQLILLPLNTLSTIYIKTLTWTNNNKIPTTNRTTNKT